MADLAKLRALDEKIQQALRKQDAVQLVPLALQYNSIAEKLDLRQEEDERAFCEIKNKVAEVYNEVSNLMHILNAKVLAALYHVQGKSYERAFKITQFLHKQAKKKAQDKFLDKNIITVVEFLALKNPDQALKEIRALKKEADPQIKEIILETANYLKIWKKGELHPDP